MLGDPEEEYRKRYSAISDISAETIKWRWKSFQVRKNPTWKDYKLGKKVGLLMTKRMSLCLAHNKQGRKNYETN